MSILMNRRRGVGKKNPYITNGLIAMFDGEWNKGLFEHDSNLTTWNDIAGKNATLNNTFDGQNFTWEGNHLRLANTAFNFQNAYICDALNNDELSVEILVRPVSCNSGTNTDLIMISPTATRGFWIYGNRIYVIATLRYRTKTNGTTINDVNWDSFFKAALYGDKFVYNNNEINFYGTETVSNTSLIGINRNKTATFDYYCMRFYDHVLTQDEIAHNAAIDAERFSIV